MAADRPTDADTDRHGIGVLRTDECLSLLRTKTVGRIAVIVGDHPEIFPVNFVVDGGTVVFRTAAGVKLDAVGTHVPVAFEADGYTGPTAWSVMVKGPASEIRGLFGQVEAAGLPVSPLVPSPRPRLVRITPTEITGRRFALMAAPDWARVSTVGRSGS